MLEKGQVKLDFIQLEKIKLNASYFGSSSILYNAASFEVTRNLCRISMPDCWRE
jgi:hypothetical protein